MSPRWVAALGLLLVAIDVRTEHFDILLDPAGWILVAVAAGRLATRPAVAAAAVAAACSVADAFLESRFVVVDPVTGEPDPGGAGPESLVFVEVTGFRLVLLMLATVAGAAAIWLLLRRLGLGLVAWLVVGAWAVPYVVGAAANADGFDPVWNGGGELVALAGIAALVAAAAALVRDA